VITRTTADGCEYDKPPVVIREDCPERKHCAEVVDETCGQYELAYLRFVEPGLDHYRVDHGDGRGGQRDPADCRCGPGPIRDVPSEQHRAEKRQQERNKPNGQALFEILPENAGLDLGSSHEREQNRAEAREERYPLRFRSRRNT